MVTEPTVHNAILRQEAKAKFLSFLAQGYSSGYSAEQAGVDRATVYRWRDSDAEFAEQWSHQWERGSDWAEDKLRDRVEAGNVDATLAMLRIRRRLVPDAAPPAIQIAVVWQVAPGELGQPGQPGQAIEGVARQLADSQPQQPESARPDSLDTPEP